MHRIYVFAGYQISSRIFKIVQRGASCFAPPLLNSPRFQIDTWIVKFLNVVFFRGKSRRVYVIHIVSSTTGWLLSFQALHDGNKHNYQSHVQRTYCPFMTPLVPTISYHLAIINIIWFLPLASYEKAKIFILRRQEWWNKADCRKSSVEIFFSL